MGGNRRRDDSVEGTGYWARVMVMVMEYNMMGVGNFIFSIIIIIIIIFW